MNTPIRDDPSKRWFQTVSDKAGTAVRDAIKWDYTISHFSI